MRTRLFAITLLLLLVTACTPIQRPAGTVPTSSVTGNDELDAIIAAAIYSDLETLQAKLAFSELPCSVADGLGGPPKCLEGDPAGTLYEVLPILGPEGHFMHKADASLEGWPGFGKVHLFAVYEVSNTVYADENYPAGEYAIVLRGPAGTQMNITLQVRNGHIVRIDNGFANPPEIRPDNVVRYLVSPGDTTP